MSGNFKICLISSHGGHFRELLEATRDVVGDKYYVTYETEHTAEALKSLPHYFVVDPHTSLFMYAINFIQSFYHVLRERPDFVISTGAGIALPSILLCKYLVRSRIIFIESAANVVNPSRTGSFVYSIADLFLVQWQSLMNHYPNAKYVGLIL